MTRKLTTGWKIRINCIDEELDVASLTRDGVVEYFSFFIFNCEFNDDWDGCVTLISEKYKVEAKIECREEIEFFGSLTFKLNLGSGKLYLSEVDGYREVVFSESLVCKNGLKKYEDVGFADAPEFWEMPPKTRQSILGEVLDLHKEMESLQDQIDDLYQDALSIDDETDDKHDREDDYGWINSIRTYAREV